MDSAVPFVTVVVSLAALLPFGFLLISGLPGKDAVSRWARATTTTTPASRSRSSRGGGSGRTSRSRTGTRRLLRSLPQWCWRTPLMRRSCGSRVWRVCSSSRASVTEPRTLRAPAAGAQGCGGAGSPARWVCWERPS